MFTVKDLGDMIDCFDGKIGREYFDAGGGESSFGGDYWYFFKDSFIFYLQFERQEWLLAG